MTHDPLETEAVVQPFVQLLHLHLEGLRLERPRDENLQLLQVHRLGEEIERAALHRLHRRFDAAVRRHHDHHRLARQGEGLVDDLEAGFARHAQVGDDHVVFLRLHEIEGLVGAGRHRDVVVFFQCLLQTLAGVLLVVDDQDAGGHGAIDATASPLVNGK